MQIMGIEAIAPKPKTTVFAKAHKVYPYLLRNMNIDEPDHVWCSDITYVPTKNGYLYLCAVMDWHSRFVLSWNLSNNLDTSMVMETLEDALSKGCPRIFNTDQGAQFTSTEFTNRLTEASVEISMDGVGRATDNAFIERLWRTVKYEEVYLKEYTSGDETYTSLNRFFRYYDYDRPHQGLGSKTPWEGPIAHDVNDGMSALSNGARRVVRIMGTTSSCSQTKGKRNELQQNKLRSSIEATTTKFVP